MRKLLAKLINGEISRRDFHCADAGMGFGMMTVESILDNAALGGDQTRARAGGETFRAEPFSEKTPYEQWMHDEGIPIHGGYFVADVRAVEVKPWKRLGAKGALIDLEGAEATDGAYLVEIGAGAGTNPQRYMFEESIYVLDGEGETTVGMRTDQSKPSNGEGYAVFTTAKYLASAQKPGSRTCSSYFVHRFPLVMDLYHNADFIFNNDFVFRDRYDHQPDYFTVNQSKMKIAGSAATFGEGEKALWRARYRFDS